MTKTRKIGLSFLLSVLFFIIMLGFSDNIAKASSPTMPVYTFKINAQKLVDGSEYELKTSSIMLNAVADGWAAPSLVEWTSSEKGVVNFEDPTTTSNSVNLLRKGPGYSTVTAKITQGGFTYSISLVVKVGLEVDYKKTGTSYATTNSDRVLIFDTVKQEKQIYLKYMDYTPADSTTPESGSEISSTAVTFESENKGVATVDEKGLVKATGGGSTKITMISSTMSSKDTPMKIELTIVVAPLFTFNYTDSKGVKYECISKPDILDASAIYNGVPSDFTLQSNATLGKNLNWVIYNVTGKGKTKVSDGKSNYMTYTINDNGTVSFDNVKAGTYEIFAFADKSYSEKTNAPYAYMKIYVPINLSQSIIMSVGDTYNVLDNSNIPDAKVFVEPTGYDTNIAKLDTSTYTITAKKEGNVKIKLIYDTGQEIFEGAVVDDMILDVTVIDGIALSTTNANLYVKGTLQLEAIVTDNTQAITWSSDNTGIATVKDGLVTGVKAGTASITASQTINGVVKTAICSVTVQQSVTSIVIDPATATLPISGYTTLHATVSPNNLSGVTLKWKSSDDSIVKIVETSALTATIQGVAGGHAVISAINQDNVVVGYCHVTVQQSVTSIVLSESATIVDLTVKRLQLRATVYPDNALNKAITWSTTDSSKATVDTNGLVTLLKPGTVTIMATSVDNAKAVAYCNLTIQIPVVSVALDETTKTMYVGQSARLSYVLLPATASNNAVIWTSTNTSVATVDVGGKVSAKGVGTAVIILKTAEGGYSVYCTITVKQVATAIKFDVSKLALKSGGFYYIKTTLTPKDSTDNELVWESSDTKVAVVDENGKVTAKNAGTAIIMARTSVGGIAYCKVDVTQPVSGLILNFMEKTIYKGEAFILTASVTPSTATKLDVTWKSSNTKVATVSKKGEVTGLVGGVAIISCSTVDGGYTAACVVTVKETVTSIKLDYQSYSLGLKKTFKLTATVSTETATNQKVAWSSSNNKIATVNQKGKVTGISVGYANITATAMDGSEVEESCEVRIVNPVTSLMVNKSTLSMYLGDSKKIKATIKPSNATFKKAKWSSSDESVAIVDDGTVIAVKAGSATITAEAMDSSGKKAICYVSVHERVASTGVTLQDKSLTMVYNESKIVNVVLIPSATTDGMKWSTDNAAVASVDKLSGKITAKSTGTAYVTVMTDSGKSATVEVTVIGLNLNKFVAEEYTTYNAALSVEGAPSSVTWRSDNPMIAIVYSDGTISTRGTGTATITATVNGRRLSCKVIVRDMS